MPAVRFLGWRDDIERLIPLFDAVLMPSRYEGFPQVPSKPSPRMCQWWGYAVGDWSTSAPELTAAPGDELALAAIVEALAREPRSWPAGEVALRRPRGVIPARGR